MIRSSAKSSFKTNQKFLFSKQKYSKLLDVELEPDTVTLTFTLKVLDKSSSSPSTTTTTTTMVSPFLFSLNVVIRIDFVVGGSVASRHTLLRRRKVFWIFVVKCPSLNAIRLRLFLLPLFFEGGLLQFCNRKLP